MSEQRRASRDVQACVPPSKCAVTEAETRRTETALQDEDQELDKLLKLQRRTEWQAKQERKAQQLEHLKQQWQVDPEGPSLWKHMSWEFEISAKQLKTGVRPCRQPWEISPSQARWMPFPDMICLQLEAAYAKFTASGNRDVSISCVSFTCNPDRQYSADFLRMHLVQNTGPRVDPWSIGCRIRRLHFDAGGPGMVACAEHSPSTVARRRIAAIYGTPRRVSSNVAPPAFSTATSHARTLPVHAMEHDTYSAHPGSSQDPCDSPHDMAWQPVSVHDFVRP